MEKLSTLGTPGGPSVIIELACGKDYRKRISGDLPHGVAFLEVDATADLVLYTSMEAGPGPCVCAGCVHNLRLGIPVCGHGSHVRDLFLGLKGARKPSSAAGVPGARANGEASVSDATSSLGALSLREEGHAEPGSGHVHSMYTPAVLEVGTEEGVTLNPRHVHIHKGVMHLDGGLYVDFSAFEAGVRCKVAENKPAERVEDLFEVIKARLAGGVELTHCKECKHYCCVVCPDFEERACVWFRKPDSVD